MQAASAAFFVLRKAGAGRAVVHAVPVLYIFARNACFCSNFL